MIEFGVKDIIDILLVAVLLYNTYRLMRESRSLNVFVGIMIFILVWVFVSQVLEMKLLGAILDKLVSVGVIVIVVIFQEDIRKGQHIEEFRLEAKDADGSWRSIARGTTVGYKRIIRFPAVTARDFRLVITASRTDPVLSEVGLYNY